MIHTNNFTLNNLQPGNAGVIHTIDGESSLNLRLAELGFVPGTRIEAVFGSPAGNPVAYGVRGSLIALRHCDAAAVILKDEGETGVCGK